MMDGLPAYASLFLTASVAGTFLPFLPAASEMTLAALLAQRSGPAAALVGIAVAGNVVGAAVNYAVGRRVADLAGRRWFPLSERLLDRARRAFKRYGIWTLLLCWIPSFGDAVTVIAGVLRADLRLFLVLVALGRLFGHAAVAGGVVWMT